MRFLTAGESHGAALTGIIEGLPAGLPIDEKYINHQLARRQGGYGRGGRMSIEKDQVKFLSGLRFGETTGAPLALVIENKDWPNWQETMSLHSQGSKDCKKVTSPRPGHADFAGGIKYLREDLRDVLERASARETAARVAIGAVASQLLEHFGIKVASFVTSVGGVSSESQLENCSAADAERSRTSQLYCLDEEAERIMVKNIERAREEGDTLGGTFKVVVEGVPIGLGSCVHWDRRLDAQLSAGLMSIPGIKGVEVGLGFTAAEMKGSKVHDELFTDDKKGIHRKSNGAGGLEGGITNGEKIVLQAAMKPIPTLQKSLSSVDLPTNSPSRASVERSDICAVPAASVVGEAVVSWELAKSFREKFGGDTITELEEAYESYRYMVKEYLKKDEI